MNIYNYKDNLLYPDRYTHSSKWVKLLPIPDRPIQTAELIEIQSLLMEQIKQGFNSFIKPFSRIQGLDISVKETREEDLLISINDGKFYIEGYTLSVKGRDIEIPKTGTHSIGLIVDENIITEIDDPSLRDPIKGNSRFGLEGAHRLIWDTTITVNNTEAYNLGQVIEGQIIQEGLGINDKLEELLARYTFDRHGNFIKRGLNVRYIETKEISLPKTTTNFIENKRDTQLSSIRQLEADISNLDTRLKDLETQLINANREASRLPTPNNIATVESIKSEIDTVENQLSLKTKELRDLQVDFAITLDNIDRNTNRINSYILLSIIPGIAYVNGYRFEKTDNTTIEVPRTLDEKIVKGARFTYRNETDYIIRTLSIQPGQSIDNAQSIYIQVNNLIYQEGSIDITFQYTIQEESLETLIDNILGEISSNKTLPSNVNWFSNTRGDINSITLRSLFKSKMDIERSIGNSLLISTDENNDIRIKTYSDGGVIWNMEDGFLRASPVNTYELGFKPVTKVTRLLADMSAVALPITRGPSTSDLLGDDTIFNILKVEQGDSIYIEGRDFVLSNQSVIEWLDLDISNSPSIGTTYYVSYIYTQPLEEEEDFRLNKDSIEFIGTTPAPNYTFTVDYAYGLSFISTIFLNDDGIISYKNSQASDNPQPIMLSDEFLKLADVLIKPNSIKITNADNRGLTVKDINNLITRIETLEGDINTIEEDLNTYDIAIEDIGEEPLSSFSDSNRTLEKIDIENTTASLVPSIRSITQGYNHKDVKVRYQSGAKERFGKIFLPYSEFKLIDQDRATGYKTVVSQDNNPLLEVKPNVINLNEYEYKLINPSTLEIYNYSDLNEGASNYISNNWLTNYEYLIEDISNNKFIQEDTDLDEFINVKSKPSRLTLYANNLSFNGYSLWINDLKITQYNLLSGTSRSQDSVVPNSNKEIKLNFELPTLEAGSHVIRLISIGGLQEIIYPITIFSNLYIELINTAINRFLPEMDPIVKTQGTSSISTDSNLFPINQSFTLPLGAMVTSIGLRLRDGSSEQPLRVYLSESMSNGLPSSNVYSEAKADNYYYSPDSSSLTIFTLDHPSLLNKGSINYINLDDNSSLYQVYTSKIGDPDIINGSRVGNQLLNKGNLYLSRDGYKFNELFEESLSYEVYVAQFINDNDYIVDLGTYGISDTFTDITSFSYNSYDLIPTQCNIRYQYKKNDNNWIDFKPNIIIDLDSTYSSLQIRAILNSNSEYVSPLLDIDNSSISLYSYKKHSEVQWNNITYNTPYNNLTIWLDVIQGDKDSSINPYMSYDNGLSWTFLDLTDTQLIDSTTGLERRKYELNQSIIGYQLKIKTELHSEELHRPPLVRNLVSYVY